LNISELIEQAKRGNKSALNKLLEENYKQLFGFVLKMTTDDKIAQDITQETLLKAVINISYFREKSKFSTWLFRISINVYKDYLRKNKVGNYLDNEYNVVNLRSIENDTLIKIEFENAIKELKSMPYKKRTAFILKHYYGYSLEEIALIMESPIGTVKSRIFKCIEALKKTLT